MQRLKQLTRIMFVPAFVVSMMAGVFIPSVASAACGGTPTYGSATLKLSVPSDGSYVLWTHMNAADTTNNSFVLEVDNAICYTFGDAGLTPGAWTWVNYQNGKTTSKVILNLSAGTHTLRAIGTEPKVKFDRILAVQDQNCTPTGNGDNCMVASDTVKPTLKINEPNNATTVSGKLSVKATATDNAAVSKVEFYVQDVLKQSDTTTPYEYEWDTKTVKDGTYVITVKAYDAAGNVSYDTRSVTVKNTVVQIPSAPTGITAKAVAQDEVALSWKAPANATGLKYRIIRDNVALATVTGTTYTDRTVVAGTKYDYHVISVDATNQVSVKPNNPVSVTTPKPAVKDTTGPTQPKSLKLTAVSKTQVNLKWKKSTDASGVKGYDIYRGTEGGAMKKIATTTSVSYGNTGLKAGTRYSYHIIARDANDNPSAPSKQMNIRTKSAQQVVKKDGKLRGSVKSDSGRPLAGADITVWVDGKRYRATANWRGRYVITNVPAGKYEVTIRHSSHTKRTFDVWVSAGQIRWQDATLR